MWNLRSTTDSEEELVPALDRVFLRADVMGVGGCENKSSFVTKDK
jgi:hypothetical protein